MAFSDVDQLINESVLDCFIEEKRPPEHLRDKLDLHYKIEGQSVIFYERRPHWKIEGLFTESNIAKATYVRTKNLWKVYWMRADLKWHSYTPCAIVPSIEAFLEILKEDKHGCFWG